MLFGTKLIHGTLIKRYKRFLTDIRLDDGEIVQAHCTNSGSMKTCIETDAEVYLLENNNPGRKTKYTWEMIKINCKWVGVNTLNANRIAFEAIKEKKIKGLESYSQLVREVKWGESRIDLMAQNKNETCYIEVKNVSMREGDFALFPDSLTKRGLKHLHTLIDMKRKGHRAVMLYIVQRSDVKKFSTAEKIDPDYAKALRLSVSQGVEVFAVMVELTPEGIFIEKRLPVIL